MAPRQGFKPNRKVIGNILKHDPGVVAAVDEIAEDARRRVGGDATVRTYTTDRHVASLEVDAEEQAVDGVGTRAVSEAAMAFRSRRQWRRAFAQKDEDAHERARATDVGYRGLPEHRGK
ncbi:hypothetical protein H7J86_26305 [Mycobacterium hackensackense]|uniref:hypothetical protein n=1 Tax=Mycobacterium hackensackense TaxID=228909 RepID=UPI002265EEBA|nr:hypothetical protein [Mycobacterium hackensackense]MCV7255682.1 hypothetical protein [Mycobacterium hackensackense]